jgi:hypothetical protein
MGARSAQIGKDSEDEVMVKLEAMKQEIISVWEPHAQQKGVS